MIEPSHPQPISPSETRKSIVVSAPTRLHFGLLAIGNQTERAYGGVGMMIKSPRTNALVKDAVSFSIQCDASVADSARLAAQNWFDNVADRKIVGESLDELPVTLGLQHVPRHYGLGSGTQMAFSIGVSLQTFFGLPMPSTAELAQALQRGKRSAIGSYGFFQGGLLVDRGIDPAQPIAELDFRSDFPEHWPVLIVTPVESDAKTVSGNLEQEAFANLSPTTQRQADEMMGLIKSMIVPGIVDLNFELFSEGLSEVGRRSGRYFLAEQGGTYASPFAQSVVDCVLDVGIFGVGQSSWGPTMFVVAPTVGQAEILKQHLIERVEGCRVEVTRADNDGVRVSHS